MAKRNEKTVRSHFGWGQIGEMTAKRRWSRGRNTKPWAARPITRLLVDLDVLFDRHVRREASWSAWITLFWTNNDFSANEKIHDPIHLPLFVSFAAKNWISHLTKIRDSHIQRRRTMLSLKICVVRWGVTAQCGDGNYVTSSFQVWSRYRWT